MIHLDPCTVFHALFMSVNRYYIATNLWLGWLLVAGLLITGCIVECAFDDRQFVFDPNFTHWAVKTGNDKAY